MRSLIGLVPQDSLLFNETIQTNITLSNKNISKNKILEASKISNSYEFIEKLDNSFDTNVGSFGGNLSGGQKQRISIARAVLNNPPIMILDEATSSLDSKSEKLVQNALENLMHNRTTLVIAHRLSTIQNADLILVMENGKIVEKGKHEKLLSKKGIYSKLIKIQSFN